jgi:hypothetical protein
MSAKPAERTTVTIQGTFNAHTFTPENIEIQGGMQSTGQLHSAQNVIEDLLTSLSNGVIFSDDTWEIQITMKQSDEHGSAASSPKRKEKKSPSTIETNYDALSNFALKARLGTFLW